MRTLYSYQAPVLGEKFIAFDGEKYKAVAIAKRLSNRMGICTGCHFLGNQCSLAPRCYGELQVVFKPVITLTAEQVSK